LDYSRSVASNEIVWQKVGEVDVKWSRMGMVGPFVPSAEEEAVWAAELLGDAIVDAAICDSMMSA